MHVESSIHWFCVEYVAGFVPNVTATIWLYVRLGGEYTLCS